MRILIMHRRSGSATDDMQMTQGADTKPGVFSIMERFGDGIQTYDIPVKGRACLQVNDINGDMIEPGFRFVNLRRGIGSGIKKCHERQGINKQFFLHINWLKGEQGSINTGLNVIGNCPLQLG